MTEFHIGQIFEKKYPPELAEWCMLNNCKLLEKSFGVFEVIEIKKDENLKKINEIYLIESSVSDRRIRGALIGVQEDIEFIKDIEQKISNLRKELEKKDDA